VHYLEHSSVQEVAVIDIADRNELTKPAAYEVLRDGDIASTERAIELMEHFRWRLAPKYNVRKVLSSFNSYPRPLPEDSTL
jgi:acyl-coenzyme A synthetase/AMP-(fatty) acid ligase